MTLENKFDDAIYNYLYAYWKEQSGEYDPKKDVIPESEMNKMHPKTKNEKKFEQWLFAQYGMTNKEQREYTFKGNLLSLGEIALSAWGIEGAGATKLVVPGKFLASNADDTAKKALQQDTIEDAVEGTLKKEVAEEVAENTAKKEIADTAEDLSQKEDILEGRKINEKKTKTPIFRKAGQEDVNLITDIKKRYNAGKTRNAAKARGTINGETIDLECISGKFTQNDYFNKGNFEPLLPDKYHYKGPIPEYINHTEQKIIEYLREKLKNTPEVSGEIEIISERIFCDNCKAIVDMFEEEFPNIKVIRVEVNK